MLKQAIEELRSGHERHGLSALPDGTTVRLRKRAGRVILTIRRKPGKLLVGKARRGEGQQVAP